MVAAAKPRLVRWFGGVFTVGHIVAGGPEDEKSEFVPRTPPYGVALRSLCMEPQAAFFHSHVVQEEASSLDAAMFTWIRTA